MKVLVTRTSTIQALGEIVPFTFHTVHERVGDVWIMRSWQNVLNGRATPVYKIDGRHKRPIGGMPIRVEVLTPYTRGRTITVIEKN